MSSATSLELPARPALDWWSLAPLAARTLQAGWLVLQIGALAVAVVATPALHVRYQTTCPEPICDILPQPTAESVQWLARLGVPLGDYATVMVGVEWLAMLAWSVLGALIVWKRPRDLVGLLIAYGGVVAASKAFLDALGDGHPDAVLPAQIGLFVTAVTMPLIIALFPNGKWVPFWARWVALVAIVYGVAVTLASTPLPNLLAALEIPLGVAPLIVLLGAQAYRYRRVSNGVQRQQTKWVLLGMGMFVLNVTLGSTVFALGLLGAPFQFVFIALCYGVFVLLGVAVTFAILRYRLFEIDVILNRTLVYGGLTAAVVGIYALVVGGLGAVLQARGEPVIALLATGTVSVLFSPLRDRLQRGANRLLFGDRDEPYAAIARLGRRLEASLAPGDVLPTIVESVASALKLPYAAIALQDGAGAIVAAEFGAVSPERPLTLPLAYQGERVGELRLAPRAGEPLLSAADRRLLGDLATQAGVAVHAVRLTRDLQLARERLVAAREEERRRLRRDLHDGLGAQLAALAIQAGALRATVRRDPAAAEEQAAELRTELRAAVADIRRLVHGLRPPALDELGLVGAIRQRAASYGAGRVNQSGEEDRQGDAALTVTVIAPDTLMSLPAAIEVAVFRIVDEAIANVAKHAAARSCVVRLEVNDALRLTVEDDGIGIAEHRMAGVGLLSMRERTEELGGHFTVARQADGPGTRLQVDLPLPILNEG